MAENLKGKYFIGSRGFYGTNSVTYKSIEMEVTKYNHDYANPITSFDWGSDTKEANLLAFAILNTIASPTVARIYANKYTQNVIAKLQDDEWKMEAIEVVKWINDNTDYTIKIEQEDENRDELLEKEKRKVQREEEFQKQVEEKLKQHQNETEEKKQFLQNNIVDRYCKELNVKYETLAKILDIPVETISNWRLENEMPKLAQKAIEFYKAGIRFKEKNIKLKIEIDRFQEELTKVQTEMSLNETDLRKYKKIINSLDIANLYKMYKEL